MRRMPARSSAMPSAPGSQRGKHARSPAGTRGWGGMRRGAPSGQGVRSMSGLPRLRVYLFHARRGSKPRSLEKFCRAPAWGGPEGKPDVPLRFSQWSQPGSNRRPRACHARALPTELWPQETFQCSSNSKSDAQLIRRRWLFQLGASGDGLADVRRSAPTAAGSTDRVVAVGSDDIDLVARVRPFANPSPARRDE